MLFLRFINDLINIDSLIAEVSQKIIDTLKKLPQSPETFLQSNRAFL